MSGRKTKRLVNVASTVVAPPWAPTLLASACESTRAPVTAAGVLRAVDTTETAEAVPGPLSGSYGIRPSVGPTLVSPAPPPPHGRYREYGKVRSQALGHYNTDFVTKTSF